MPHIIICGIVARKRKSSRISFFLPRNFHLSTRQQYLLWHITCIKFVNKGRREEPTHNKGRIQGHATPAAIRVHIVYIMLESVEESLCPTKIISLSTRIITSADTKRGHVMFSLTRVFPRPTCRTQKHKCPPPLPSPSPSTLAAILSQVVVFCFSAFYSNATDLCTYALCASSYTGDRPADVAGSVS